ncbi:unnamed protein product, partial [Meganyctiphanes norvegica]
STFLTIFCFLIIEGNLTPIENVTEDGSRQLSGRSRLVRRQTPQFPILTLVVHYSGTDEPSDICGRDEVFLGNGTKHESYCYNILTQGPCQIDELVLVNATTREGYCGSRVCGPDRVFLFGDQMCHDPWEPGICPPGRVLSTTAYGTPVCGCPDGTYESDDDLDDDVCEPILSEILTCPKGQ